MLMTVSAKLCLIVARDTLYHMDAHVLHRVHARQLPQASDRDK